jgi:DNA-binding response OmpR family regulator
MADGGALRILLLEDEPLIALSTQQALEDLGHGDVDVFYRLDPAVEAAGSTRYDVAILDVNVDRRRTSLDLARKLRADGTAIVFASGNSVDRADLDELAHVTLGKPYSPADLDRAMRSLPADR